MTTRNTRFPARSVLLLCIGLLLAVLQGSAFAQSSSQDGQTDGAGSTSTQGQGRRAGPPSPAMELDHLIKAMKAASVPLSDAQKVSILGILEDRESAQQSLLSSTATDRSAAMQQMQALEKASRTAILAVLSEAQQKVYSSMRQRPSGPPSEAPSQDGSGSPSEPPSGSNDQADSNIDANTGGGIQQSAQGSTQTSAQ